MNPHVAAGPALAVDSLSKRFGEWSPFDGVSFEVGHDEVFGFLGSYAVCALFLVFTEPFARPGVDDRQQMRPPGVRRARLRAACRPCAGCALASP